jgi:hypothetical protein
MRVVVGFASLHWFDMFHSRGKMDVSPQYAFDEGSRSAGLGGKLVLASEEFLKRRDA